MRASNSCTVSPVGCGELVASTSETGASLSQHSQRRGMALATRPESGIAAVTKSLLVDTLELVRPKKFVRVQIIQQVALMHVPART